MRGFLLSGVWLPFVTKGHLPARAHSQGRVVRFAPPALVYLHRASSGCLEARPRGPHAAPHLLSLPSPTRPSPICRSVSPGRGAFASRASLSLLGSTGIHPLPTGWDPSLPTCLLWAGRDPTSPPPPTCRLFLPRLCSGLNRSRSSSVPRAHSWMRRAKAKETWIKLNFLTACSPLTCRG